MMSGINRNLLSAEVQQYINENLQSNLPTLLLKRSPFPQVSMSEIVQQIKGKNVAAKKFPFLRSEGIRFPPNINLEQASSQATAEFKARNLSGDKFLDLTAGFGIDAYFLSRNFREVTLVEQSSTLMETVNHNWTILGREANFINDSLENFLAQNSEHFDLIYLDPARRDDSKNKKFLLEDLSPNLLKIQDKLKQISSGIIVKLSPLIDISYIVSVIPHMIKIQIIAVRNEVRELLVFIRPAAEITDVAISCVNLENPDAEFNFKFNDEKAATTSYSDALKYIFIPNNAVLKSGAFNLISGKFQLQKLHPNSHIYTSELPVANFPGRVMHVEKISAKELKTGERFNIISKNHPLSPEQIKDKYKIKDGGPGYLIFTKSISGTIILKSLPE